MNKKELKQLIKEEIKHILEDEFQWSDVLGTDSKWEDLEKDLMVIVDKYSDKFGVDSYGVIDAMHQVIDGMFQKK